MGGGTFLPILGVFLCALGTVVNTSGMLYMKRAFLLEPDRPFYLRRYFWLGIGLVVLNATAFDLVVYAVSPLGLIAPVSSLTVVWGNVFASRGWVTGEKENVNGMVVRANAVIMGGILATTVFGPKSADLPSPETMREQLQSGWVRLYILASMGAIGGSVWALLFSKRGSGSWGGTRSSSGSLSGNISFLFPFTSALCASLSVVSFKVVAIYLARHLSSSHSPLGAGMFMALTVAIVLSILNAVLLNAGMESARASYLVSTYQALVIIFTVLAGGLFYNEFQQMKESGSHKIIGFCLGVAIAIGGIGWLSYLQPSPSPGQGRDVGGSMQEYVAVELQNAHANGQSQATGDDHEELLECDVDAEVGVTVTDASII